MIGFILARNQSCPIGNIFTDGMFATLIPFQEELKKSSKGFINGCTIPRMLELFAPLAEKPKKDPKNPDGPLIDTFGNVKKVLLAKGPIPEDAVRFFIDSGQLDEDIDLNATEAIQKTILEWYKETMLSRLVPIREIACGILKSLPLQINQEGYRILIENWAGLNFAPISYLVQGTLNKEALLNLIDVEGGTEEKRLALKSWIEKWVRAQPNDNKTLENMLQTATGSASIASRLVFRFVKEGRGLNSHTCFNIVDVPEGMDEETFMARFNAWGRGEDKNLMNLS